MIKHTDIEAKVKAIKQAREMLNWFEANDVMLPDSLIFWPSGCTASTYVLNSEGGKEVMIDLARVCRDTHTKATKEYTSGYFVLQFNIGESSVRTICDRAMVCERKVVGTRVVPATTTPEHVVEEVEWECKESLLKAGEIKEVGEVG